MRGRGEALRNLPHHRNTGFVVVSAVIAFLIVVAALPGPASGAVKEGDPFPHFTGVDLDGNTVDTKALDGKAIILDFWSIYCATCIQEMPHIVALYEKYKDQGLAVIGVDLDPFKASRVKKFISGLDFSIPYPNIHDSRMQVKALVGVSMLPTTVLVDPGGVVRLFHVGYKPGFEKELEELIRQHLPAP